MPIATRHDRRAAFNFNCFAPLTFPHATGDTTGGDRRISLGSYPVVSLDSSHKLRAAFNYGTPLVLTFPPVIGGLTSEDRVICLDSFPGFGFGTEKSMRTLIREGIQYGLEHITQDSLYAVTIGHIDFDEYQQFELMDHPTINVDFEREEYRSWDSHACGYLRKLATVKLSVLIQDINEILPAEAKILADIESYFLTYPHIPTEDGIASALYTDVHTPTYRGLVNNVPFGSIDITLSIMYRQSLFNPYSSNQSTSPPALTGLPPEEVSISKGESLREAVLYNLEKVTTDNGYRNTLEVHRNVLPGIYAVNFPAANVVPDPETVRNLGNPIYHDSSYHKEIDYHISIIHQSIDNIQKAEEDIISDIEKVILNNYTLPDSDGRKNCRTAMFIENSVTGIKSDIPESYIDMVLRCRYRQRFTNPKKPTYP